MNRDKIINEIFGAQSGVTRWETEEAREARLSDIQAMKANIDTEPVNPQKVMELFRMKEIALQKKLKDPNYQIEEEQSGMVY